MGQLNLMLSGQIINKHLLKLLLIIYMIMATASICFCFRQGVNIPIERCPNIVYGQYVFVRLCEKTTILTEIIRFAMY